MLGLSLFLAPSAAALAPPPVTLRAQATSPSTVALAVALRPAARIPGGTSTIQLHIRVGTASVLNAYGINPRNWRGGNFLTSGLRSGTTICYMMRFVGAQKRRAVSAWSPPACATTAMPPSGSPGGQAPVQAGPIWQWAIGRNITDPQLRPFIAQAGRMYSMGVYLNIEGQLVTHVVLYNDERTLGYGTSSNTYSAYQGPLPGGLTWADTPSVVLRKLGTPDRQYTEGYGVEAFFTYFNKGGYSLEVTFVARHKQDLPTSPMHCITVRPPQ
jgi:hypothetical protein